MPPETCSQGQGYRVILLVILIVTLNITLFDFVVINSLSCVRLTVLRLPAAARRVSSDCHSLGVSDAMHPRSPAAVIVVDYVSIIHPYTTDISHCKIPLLSATNEIAHEELVGLRSCDIIICLGCRSKSKHSNTQNCSAAHAIGRTGIYTDIPQFFFSSSN